MFLPSIDDVLDQWQASHRLTEAATDAGAAMLKVTRMARERFVDALDGDAIRAAAVTWHDAGILLVVEPEDQRLRLLARMLASGFQYLSQDLVGLRHDDGMMQGFKGPLNGSADVMRDLHSPKFSRLQPIADSDRMLIAPEPEWVSPADAVPCRLIVLAEQRDNSPLLVRRATDSERDIALAKAGFTTESVAWAPDALCLSIAYSNASDLPPATTTLMKMVLTAGLSPAELAEVADGLARWQSTDGLPEPEITPARPRRNLDARLTIGMATKDDYDGVYFTLQALRLYHPEVMDQIEFIVIDNNPAGPCARPLKQLERAIDNYRYIPESRRRGTSVRDEIFAQASTPYVLCVDCHVLFSPGAIATLIRYFDAHPETIDLIQGPLLWDDLKSLSSHWQPGWDQGLFGTWAHDPVADAIDAAPFPIPMQGLGVFACRKAAWPGFNPDFRGFGGEEGYIHDKFRQHGGQVVLLPALRWVHRFARPLGVPYAINWEDRFLNYLIGRDELNLSSDDVVQHMTEHLGVDHTGRILAQYAEFRASLGRLPSPEATRDPAPAE